MAFGFSPKYNQDILIEELSPRQFLALAHESVKHLGWGISRLTEKGFIAHTKISAASWGEMVEMEIDENVAHLKSEVTGNQLFDWGRNKRNVLDFIQTMNELRSQFSPEILDQNFESLRNSFPPDDEDQSSMIPNVTKNPLLNFFSLFIPKPGFSVTPIIIDLNILVFILMVISGVNFFLPDNESLLLWGANFKPMTLDGQWWRLLTCCFLHIGIFHLLFNMYALLYVGVLLEPLLGSFRFAIAYLLTGITSSLASLWWHDNMISAGASGAIFGMYGVFLAMLTTNLIEKNARRTLLTSIAIFVGYNLMNGLKGGIDNAAHIGGLLGGLVIGYANYPDLKKNESYEMKYIVGGVLSAMVLGLAAFEYNTLPNDIKLYDIKMEQFASLEQEALAVYQLPEETPKQKILSAIKDQGIYNWKKCINVINDADKLNVPEIIHDRDKKLLKYCDIRIKSYELLYRNFNGDTTDYSAQLQEVTQEIESVIDDLKNANSE